MIAIPNAEIPDDAVNVEIAFRDEDGYIVWHMFNLPLIEIDQEDEEAVLFLARMRKGMREGKSWREFLDEERRTDEE